VAGAAFGDGLASFFVAGAVCGEIWKDSRSTEGCIFQYKMLLVSVKSNLFSDHGQNGLGSAAHWK